MSEELVEVVSSKIQRRGRVSNKRDKRLDEVKHHKKGEFWSEAKKLECAMLYIVLGIPRKVEEFTGVPAATIHSWRQQPWWEDTVRRIRDEHNDELDSKMTGIMDKALHGIAKGLEEGDTKYDSRTGSFYNLPLSTKDAGVILSIVAEKRAILRATPNSISNDMSTDQRLEKLGAAFKKYSQAKEIDGECSVVEANEDEAVC